MFKFTQYSAAILCAAAAFGQPLQQRQAMIRGGGSASSGKCTIEVVVDGNAEVQVQGSSANLRTTAGQPAQWRRFECTSAMPANPANFRFAGVDGRGRQNLVRDPRNGGGAVVAISDPDGGAEGYTFDLMWGADVGGWNNTPQNGPGGYRDYNDDRYRPDYRSSEYYRLYGHGFSVDDAIEGCRTSIMTQANRRFRGSNVHIRRTDIDDQPGRLDWVVGSMDVHRGPRWDRFNFSCSVNFNNGRVLTANIDRTPIR